MSDTNEKSATCGNPKHNQVLCDGSGYDCTPAPPPSATCAKWDRRCSICHELESYWRHAAFRNNHVFVPDHDVHNEACGCVVMPAPAPSEPGARKHTCNHYDDTCQVCGRQCMGFAPAPSGAAVSLPPWTLCAQCGFDVETDEDGCCVDCGSDALQVHGGPDPRLAAPRLPAEVVAVLVAVDRVDSEGFDEGHSDQRIDKAVRTWRAAGRPGLSREGEKK